MEATVITDDEGADSDDSDDQEAGYHLRRLTGKTAPPRDPALPIPRSGRAGAIPKPKLNTIAMPPAKPAMQTPRVTKRPIAQKCQLNAKLPVQRVGKPLVNNSV